MSYISKLNTVNLRPIEKKVETNKDNIDVHDGKINDIENEIINLDDQYVTHSELTTELLQYNTKMEIDIKLENLDFMTETDIIDYDTVNLIPKFNDIWDAINDIPATYSTINDTEQAIDEKISINNAMYDTTQVLDTKLLNYYTTFESDQLLSNKADELFVTTNYYNRTYIDNLPVPTYSHSLYNMPSYYYYFPFHIHLGGSNHYNVTSGIDNCVFRIIEKSTVEIIVSAQFKITDAVINTAEALKIRLPMKMAQSWAYTQTFGSPTYINKNISGVLCGSIEYGFRTIDFLSISNNGANSEYMYFHYYARNIHTLQNIPLSDIYNKNIDVRFKISYVAAYPLVPQF